MNLRDALINQSPSLALQRAAADEIARQDAMLAAWTEFYTALKAQQDHEAAWADLTPDAAAVRAWSEKNIELHRAIDAALVKVQELL